jgi:hypothetical protein
MSFLIINNTEVPAPDVGATLTVATNVDAGKNANGTFVGQKVGRDQYKIDSLQWSFLTATEWSTILRLFDDFRVVARFPDMVNNRFTTLILYPGNRTAIPIEWDDEGLPTMYKSCKVNLIDCGEL